jgi:ABC-type maltose transport system permease subunit
MVPVVNAATLITMIPVFIVFFLCQKQLVEGITSSGIKG